MEKPDYSHKKLDTSQDERDFLLWLRSQKVNFNRTRLSTEERENLRQRIHTSLHSLRKKKRRLFLYRASASLLGILVLSFYLFRWSDKDDSLSPVTATVAWQPLQSDSIRLVSGNATASFQENIQLTLGKDGSATIYRTQDKIRKFDMQYGKLNELTVPYGKRSEIKLEDGTEIWINSGSMLQFPTHFAKNMREINLIGEMYIEVAPDSTPFVVHTEHFDIQVYGTCFNVSSYQEGVPLSCALVDGEVDFILKSGEEIRMKSGDVMRKSNGRWEKKKDDPLEYTSWKNGYIELKDDNMIEILNYIARYYNLSLDYGGESEILKQKKCTGKIYLSDNVDNVLTTLSLLYSIDYKKDRRTIIISNNP